MQIFMILHYILHQFCILQNWSLPGVIVSCVTNLANSFDRTARGFAFEIKTRPWWEFNSGLRTFWWMMEVILLWKKTWIWVWNIKNGIPILYPSFLNGLYLCPNMTLENEIKDRWLHISWSRKYKWAIFFSWIGFEKAISKICVHLWSRFWLNFYPTSICCLQKNHEINVKRNSPTEFEQRWKQCLPDQFGKTGSHNVWANMKTFFDSLHWKYKSDD